MKVSAAVARKSLDFQQRLVKAEQQTVRDTLAAADKQSSGAYSQDDLDKAGNPFSAARPDDSFDAATVNQGVSSDGKPRLLRVSWQSSGPVLSGNGITTVVWNTDENQKYLLGTPAMRPRPVKDAILAQVQPARVLRLHRAIRGDKNA